MRPQLLAHAHRAVAISKIRQLTSYESKAFDPFPPPGLILMGASMVEPSVARARV